jgi:hypothetical protein
LNEGWLKRALGAALKRDRSSSRVVNVMPPMRIAKKQRQRPIGTPKN